MTERREEGRKEGKKGEAQFQPLGKVDLPRTAQ